MITRIPAVVMALCLALTLMSAMPADKKQVSDDYLVDQVRLKLASDPLVKGGALSVEVKAGIVTLEGKVEKEKYRQRAESLAKKVKGVKGVLNQLKVEPR